MKTKMTVAVLLITMNLCGQNKLILKSDSVQAFKIRRGIWFTPNEVNRINGLAVGFQALNVNNDTLEINGANASAGMATLFLLPYLIDWQLSGKKALLRDGQGHLDLDPDSSNALSENTIIRGISLSMGGEVGISVHGVNLAGGITAGKNLYGISVTGYFTKVVSFRGICISGVQNIAEKGRGIQIGIFNRCKNLKGLQLGLWNKSGKRGLPFFNWGV